MLPGSRIFPDYLQMLDEVKLDAVTVTVPNRRHLDIVRACARLHIHVWFEKPMAATASQAREMEKFARDSGITLMISYHPLWSAPMRAVTSKIAAGDIGTIGRLKSANSFTQRWRRVFRCPTASYDLFVPDSYVASPLQSNAASNVD